MNNITKTIMSNKKQTSVEWFIDQIIKEKGLVDLDIEAAKELHKQEIFDAYKSGSDYRATTQEAEQYYKEEYETDN